MEQSRSMVGGLVALAALFFSLSFFFWKKNRKVYNLPPGPPKWPLLGHLPLLLNPRKQPHHTMRDVAKEYGPVVLLKLGAVNQVFISDPTAVHECYKLKDHLLSYKPIDMAYGRYLIYGNYHIAFADQGDYWRYARKIFVTEVLSNKRIQHFEPLRSEEVGLTCLDLAQAAEGKDAVNLSSTIMHLLLNVVTRMSMGRRFYGSRSEKTSESAEMHYLIREMFHLFTQFVIEDYFPALGFVDRLTGLRPKMQAVRRRFGVALDKILDEKRRKLAEMKAVADAGGEEYKPSTFVEVLMSLPDEHGTAPLSDAIVKALTLEMLAAGSETQAVTIEWAMSELLANPRVLEKVQAEIDAVVGKDRYVTEADSTSANFPYLYLVLKETWRLHMVSPWILPKANRDACQIGGYDIPPNSTISIQHWAMGRDPALWEEPLLFKPERFADNGIEANGQHMSLIPFGSGRRICPGLGFAMNMVHFTVARLVHSFDWKLPNGMKPSELDMSESFGLTLPRTIPLEAHPIPRLSPHVYKTPTPWN